MYRKDYILRLVEEMTQMISKVFGLKQERKLNEALWEIDEMLSRRFRLNAKLLKSLSAEDIVQLFRNSSMIEADQLQSVARLLEEEAKIYREMDRFEDGNTLLVKALHLYMTASLHGGDRHMLDMSLPDKIYELLERARPYALPDVTERLLFAFTEQEGAYAAAEDSLFRLLQREMADYREGKLFYERLLKLDPNELQRGGLPLEEVQEGLQEMGLRYSHKTKTKDFD
ncbi:DUF6483 family protein [Paenibacillus faecalis]|uniref:DUF6483 family protein n=1 Tax=Paenibacillus faecalis TaxID=2079532 RepID=UPI000D10FDDB|nr:DUF6483 family protein [Paenibacillus faecalis]